MNEILELMENGVYYGEYDNGISYNIAYETAQIRENMLNWFPFEKGKRIAYLCNGYGAVVPYLCRVFKEVLVFADDGGMAEYIEKRTRMYSNITVVRGDIFMLEGIQELDYILVDDYFYAACNGMKVNQPEICLIKRCMDMLGENGEILLALDNRLALSAFGGAYNNHTEDNLFQQIDRSGKARLFSKAELIDMMERSGIADYKFYYCFPNYAWPRSIYTDESISFMRFGHHYNSIGKDRYNLFDEFKVNYELQDNGCVDVFANSFFIRMSKNKLRDMKLVYAKNQYFIDKQHKTCTLIFQDSEKRWVEKRGLNEEAQRYLEAFYQDMLKLEKYPQECFRYIPYKKTDKGILEMPYVEGESVTAVLEKKLSAVLADCSEEKKSVEDLYDVFKEIYVIMKESACLIGKKEMYSAEFVQYFGDAQLEKEQLCLNPVTLDLHTDHMYKKGNRYEIIDSDPIAFFWVPIDYIIYRLIESWHYSFVYKYKRAEEIIKIADAYEYIGLDCSNIKVYELWKNKVFSNAKAASQIEPFYAKVYEPCFKNYEDIQKYGRERSSKSRFQAAREETAGSDLYKIKKSDRFILYGAAALGKVCLDILQGAGYPVIGFIDKRSNEIKEAHGLPVWGIEKAEKAQDIIVLISIKNVFEHQGIADNLCRCGYEKIIFLPQECIEGAADSKLQIIYDTYNCILGYKGKDSTDLKMERELPLYRKKSELQLANTGIVSEDKDYVTVNLPITNLFTAQQKVNSNYPWAEQSIISLVPHTALYRYFWGEGKDKTQYYIDFCSYGAIGSGVEMTEGWKKNLISNRLSVLSEMKKSLEQDPNFFIRNAPKAIWNSEKRYFNLNEGRHRAALFVYEGRYTMPVSIKKDEFEDYYNNKEVIRVQEYFNALDREAVLAAPISHPAFSNMKCKKPQYFSFVMKTIVEFLSEFLLRRDGIVDFGKVSAGLLLDDCGELKRLLSKAGCNVSNLRQETELETIVDRVFGFQAAAALESSFDVLILDSDVLEYEANWKDMMKKGVNAQFIFQIAEREKAEEAIEALKAYNYEYKRMKSCFYDEKQMSLGLFYKKEDEIALVPDLWH